MRPFYITRVLMMTIAFVLVVFIIRGANSKNMDNVFQSLGLSPGTADSPGIEPGARTLHAGDERFNLCKTRIAAVIWPGDKRIEEDHSSMKIRWMAYDPQPREINSLDVEAWLSHHCQIIVHPVDPHEHAGVAGVSQVIFRFVDKTEAKYERFADNQYQDDKIAFRSEDLTASLAELEKIAGFAAVPAH